MSSPIFLAIAAGAARVAAPVKSGIDACKVRAQALRQGLIARGEAG